MVNVKLYLITNFILFIIHYSNVDHQIINILLILSIKYQLIINYHYIQLYNYLGVILSGIIKTNIGYLNGFKNFLKFLPDFYIINHHNFLNLISLKVTDHQLIQA